MVWQDGSRVWLLSRKAKRKDSDSTPRKKARNLGRGSTESGVQEAERKRQYLNSGEVDTLNFEVFDDTSCIQMRQSSINRVSNAGATNRFNRQINKVTLPHVNIKPFRSIQISRQRNVRVFGFFCGTITGLCSHLRDPMLSRTTTLLECPL